MKFNRRLRKTSCKSIKPKRMTNSDRKTSIAKADVQTSDLPRPSRQKAKECKTRIQSVLFHFHDKKEKKTNQ